MKGIFCPIDNVRRLKVSKTFQTNFFSSNFSPQVYAVDEQNLFIRNFWYDGTGPDAFFWVGTTPMPTPKGWVVPYPPVNMESSNMGKLIL